MLSELKSHETLLAAAVPVRWHAPLPTAASWTQLGAPAPALRGVDVLLIIARHHQATTPVPALIAQVLRSSFVLEALARQLIQRM